MVATRASKQPTLPGLQNGTPKSKPASRSGIFKPAKAPPRKKKIKLCTICVCKNCEREMPPAEPEEALEFDLTRAPAATIGKRSRDDIDDIRLFPASKRAFISTPTPKARSTDNLDPPNASRGSQTDPGRNRLSSRRPHRAALQYPPFYQPYQPNPSEQNKLALLNAQLFPPGVDMAENDQQADNDQIEQATQKSQHAGQPAAESAEPQTPAPAQQRDYQPAEESPTSAPTQQEPQPTTDTHSQSAHSGFLRSAFHLFASPARIFQRTPSNPTIHQHKSPPTVEQPSTPVQEEEEDSTPRLGRSIFSGKPSAYHTPAAELDKLERKGTPLVRMTDEQVKAQLAKEAYEIEKRNREMGIVPPAYQGYQAPSAEDVEDAGTPPPSTGQKRKLSTIDGMLPGPKPGGFGISDEYLDQDNHIEGIGETMLSSDFADTPVAKARKITAVQTPRSALKRPATSVGAGSTRKKVFFNTNPVASVRGLTPNYGRTGHYNGSTFSDIPRNFDGDSTSSLVENNHSTSDSPLSNTFNNSPTTFMNTLANERVDRTMDPATRDPNDVNWRPSPANPRPGQFCLPDFDDDDEDDMSAVQEDTTITVTPASPRPAHAGLPQSPKTPQPTKSPQPPQSAQSTASSLFPSFNESSVLFESTDLALNKARSQAEKYKPKDSSRLSQVEAARSRSSSPPLNNANSPTTDANKGKVKERAVNEDDEADKENDEQSPDDPDRDERGMNQYDRIHEHDQWADNLFNAIEPLTRAQAGLTSQEMQDYVAANWTEEDSRQSAEFWDAEWDRILAAAADAERRGLELNFLTD